MQAPGRSDEDPRGGFEHGGWAVPYQATGSLMGERTGETGALLFGRRTYEDFAGFWPNQRDNPYTEVLNNTPKYVASTTLNEPLRWRNFRLLNGDAADAVAGLKGGPATKLSCLAAASWCSR
jgi:dihydrofolate reductase